MTTHRHLQDSWEGYQDVVCFEIGEHCCLRPVGRYGKDDNWISGYIIAHDVEGEEFRCEGAVNTDPEMTKDGKFWESTGSLQGGDLTLTPSILCTTHPEFHAYITNGRWTG
jgi:hypothetical protein